MPSGIFWWKILCWLPKRFKILIHDNLWAIWQFHIRYQFSKRIKLPFRMTIFLRDWLVKRIRSNVLCTKKHPPKHAIDRSLPIKSRIFEKYQIILSPNDPVVTGFMFFMILSRNWIILRERNVWKWRDVAEFERKELVKAWVQKNNAFDKTYDMSTSMLVTDVDDKIDVGDRFDQFTFSVVRQPRIRIVLKCHQFEKFCHQHHLAQSQCIYFELEIEVRVYRSLRQASTALLIIAVISIIFR